MESCGSQLFHFSRSPVATCSQLEIEIQFLACLLAAVAAAVAVVVVAVAVAVSVFGLLKSVGRGKGYILYSESHHA